MKVEIGHGTYGGVETCGGCQFFSRTELDQARCGLGLNNDTFHCARPPTECPGPGTYALIPDTQVGVDIETVSELREQLSKAIEIGENLEISTAENDALLAKLPEVTE